MFLLEVSSFSFIFGLTQDAVDIFIFGLLLVFLAVGLRWIFKHQKQKTDN